MIRHWSALDPVLAFLMTMNSTRFPPPWSLFLDCPVFVSKGLYLTCMTRSFISTCLYVECLCVCEREAGFASSLIFPLLYLDDVLSLSRQNFHLPAFPRISSIHPCLANTKPTVWMTCCSVPVRRTVPRAGGVITSRRNASSSTSPQS